MNTVVLGTPSIPLDLRSPADFFDWLIEQMGAGGRYAIITYDEIAALADSWSNAKEEKSNDRDS